MGGSIADSNSDRGGDEESVEHVARRLRELMDVRDMGMGRAAREGGGSKKGELGRDGEEWGGRGD